MLTINFFLLSALHLNEVTKATGSVENVTSFSDFISNKNTVDSSLNLNTGKLLSRIHILLKFKYFYFHRLVSWNWSLNASVMKNCFSKYKILSGTRLMCLRESMFVCRSWLATLHTLMFATTKANVKTASQWRKTAFRH